MPASRRGRTGSSRGRTPSVNDGALTSYGRRTTRIRLEKDLTWTTCDAYSKQRRISTRIHKLLRALERWHPQFLDWWREQGPAASRRTRSTCAPPSASTRPAGRTIDYVRMPEYRWGIFLAPVRASATIHFGDLHRRAVLGGRSRRTSQRTAPADRHAGRHRARLGGAAAPPRAQRAVALRHAQSLPGERRGGAPPLGDGLSAALVLRQGRPRRGRGHARAPLGRPRHAAILSTFNDPIDDWLDFFCFATYTDRDGKYQLGSLAESAFTRSRAPRASC